MFTHREEEKKNVKKVRLKVPNRTRSKPFKIPGIFRPSTEDTTVFVIPRRCKLPTTALQRALLASLAYKRPVFLIRAAI